jgi:hypothetical protein
MPQPHADHFPKSKYGVICQHHGKQGLTKEMYNYQMNKANDVWRCPCCQQPADWDDDRYEAGNSGKQLGSMNAMFDGTNQQGMADLIEHLYQAIMDGATLCMSPVTAVPFITAATESGATELISIKQVDMLPDGVVVCMYPGVTMEDVMRHELGLGPDTLLH